MDKIIVKKNEGNCKLSSYKLTIFGDEETLKSYKGKTELTRVWIPDTSFIIRRSLFPQFAGCTRMSRKHFEIICEEENDDQNCFIIDLSSNGTLLDSSKLKKGIKTLIKDGSQIGILWKKDIDETQVQFGLRFSRIEHIDSETDLIQKGISSNSGSENNLEIKIDEEQNLTEIPEDVIEDELDEENEEPVSLEQDSHQNIEESSHKRKSKGSFKRFKSKFRRKIHNDEDYDSIDEKPIHKISEKKWTLEEEERLATIAQKRKDGKSWKEIAGEFPRRTIEAVRTKYKKMTMIEPDKVQISPLTSQDNANESNSDITHAVSNISSNTIHREEDRRGKLWTAEEDQKLRELVQKIQPKDPADWNTLANQLGRTVKSCKHKFNDYNLKDLIR